MPKNCTVCGQPTEKEPGFYYGTGYVSYALGVTISVTTFVAWFVLIGMSVHDNRFFYWLIVNGVILVLIQDSSHSLEAAHHQTVILTIINCIPLHRQFKCPNNG